MDLVVRSLRVVTPTGVAPAAVLVSGGRFGGLAGYAEPVVAARELDAGDAVVMAGLVDTHVHVNEPGRTEWEGFDTAGRAAAAGGVTTIVDMPLNGLPVTTTAAALRLRVEAAAERCRADHGFWGGIVPGSGREITDLVAAGALGLKAFLVPSGIEEFPAVDPAGLETAMRQAAEMDVPVLVHAEDPDELERAGSPENGCYAGWLASRPAAAEERAIERVTRLAGETGARAHVVHLATAGALPAIARARHAGVRLSVETCPHYLTFAAEEVEDGDTRFKCAPPIREAAHREGLWEGLTAGTIDLVVSDHSPCPPALKPAGDFSRAWGGIASLELRLAAVWTGARARGATIADLARWLCEAPARLAGLANRKGSIAPGLDADLVVWRPERTFPVRVDSLHQRHPSTPYEGRELAGVVETTFLRGAVVFDRGEFPGAPRGRWLRREG